MGACSRRGILVDWTGDIGRIENVQFHSHFWAHPAFAGNWKRVFAYMQQNLEAFIFGRTDWEYVNNTFVFPGQSRLSLHREQARTAPATASSPASAPTPATPACWSKPSNLRAC